MVEIARVLHERMDASRYLGADAEDEKTESTLKPPERHPRLTTSGA
ncbi:hypothetical protein [Roseiarcus sp.]